MTRSFFCENWWKVAPIVRRAKKILYHIETSEDGTAAAPVLASGKDIDSNVQVQLNLFRRPEHLVVEKLQKLDLSKMTPLEALNCLNELQEKAKNSK